MTALTTTANLVEQSALDEETQLTATLERGEVEALLAEERPYQLWFELGTEGEADPYRLTVELTEGDVRALLAGASGDEIPLALDGRELAGILEEPDVEAHGLRGALAVSVAIATTALAAPVAGLAATSPATSPAATQQSVSAATTQQAVGAAAATQVVRQVVSQQLRPGAKSQRVSALKLGSLSILRAGAVR